MKKTRFILNLALLSLLVACNSNDSKLSTDLINIAPSADNNRSSEEMPRISFQTTEYDFGKILEGQKVEYVYNFTNSGKSDLIISEVITSCGCTSAKDWSKKPYKPGEEGTITVVFDSDKKAGFNNKKITVLCNTAPSVNELRLSGEVVGPK